jgi:hypothetical protein
LAQAAGGTGGAAQGPCGAGQGVTIVVENGQDTAVRCAPGSYPSGLDALDAAGFSYEFRPGFPGMVCVIDTVPSACNGAPAEAYWSFWLGDQGQWAYATMGPGRAAAPAGSVQGWAFGAGTAPATAPPGAGTGPSASSVERGASPRSGSARHGATGQTGPNGAVIAAGAIVIVLAIATPVIARRRKR